MQLRLQTERGNFAQLVSIVWMDGWMYEVVGLVLVSFMAPYKTRRLVWLCVIKFHKYHVYFIFSEFFLLYFYNFIKWLRYIVNTAAGLVVAVVGNSCYLIWYFTSIS